MLNIKTWWADTYSGDKIGLILSVISILAIIINYIAIRRREKKKENGGKQK